METCIKPSIDEARDLIIKSIEKCAVIIVSGRCSVQYQGRASSKLSPGERIILIKEDGALLVHQPTGYEPVNWMPGQSSIYHVLVRDNSLEIHAVRTKPSESVKVLFSKVQMVSALNLADSGEFSLYASEEDMHKAVLLKPSLLEEGFKPISYEKQVKPGFVDVYGVDKNGKLVVVEIKRKTAGKEAALQLAKYIEAIRSKADRQVRGVLAAPGIAKDVQKTLEILGLEFRHLDPKKCSETLRKAETKKLAEFFNDENRTT
jgi:RecB family endonuclease NucS